MKYFLIVLVAIVLASCSPFGINTMGYASPHYDLDTAWRMAASIEYKADTVNYCQSPRETARLGTGDCEDITAYMMYLLGEDTQLASGYTPWDSTLHAVLFYKDEYLEPQTVGYKFTSETIGPEKLYSYAYIMANFTYWGTKSL